MCLHLSKKSVLKVATEDVECYKIIERDPTTGLYHTPFTEKVVGAGAVKGKYPMNARKDSKIVSKEDLFKKEALRQLHLLSTGLSSNFGEGGIHTFATKSGTKELGEWLNRVDSDREICVFRCAIPKGALYLNGYDEDGFASYASTKIMFKEEIKRYVPNT